MDNKSSDLLRRGCRQKRLCE